MSEHARGVRDRVLVGLGGNIGDRLSTLRSAFTALASLPQTTLAGHSAPYETHPVGPSTAAFLNAAADLRTGLAPRALLDALLAIERQHGRVRSLRWAPRTLDLDILLWLRETPRGWAHRTVDEPGLTIPHPGVTERDFVLAPLHDMAPDLLVGGGQTASQWLRRLPRQTRTVIARVAANMVPV